ncbi:MAG: isoprenylcysteine carboxylmethyltransferase family protein [Eubacterium sp.]|nr:isoprenylcysteine carboxylmethyltransferase family protein [Eubacterium sp.]
MADIKDRLKSVKDEDVKYEGVDDDLLQELEDEFAERKVVKVTAKPLPAYGAGPLFGGVAIVLTLLGIIFGHTAPFDKGISSTFRIPYIVIGAILIVIALFIWKKALVDDNIDDYIRSGKLQTKGIYSVTRNPIYCAILFICSGALFISGNVYMYVLPIVFWIFLTILLQKTEEPLLLARFGDEYKKYMRDTYRIMPLKKR